MSCTVTTFSNSVMGTLAFKEDKFKMQLWTMAWYQLFQHRVMLFGSLWISFGLLANGPPKPWSGPCRKSWTSMRRAHISCPLARRQSEAAQQRDRANHTLKEFQNSIRVSMHTHGWIWKTMEQSVDGRREQWYHPVVSRKNETTAPPALAFSYLEQKILQYITYIYIYIAMS